MIGMASACSGGSALGNYVMNTSKGYELDRNNLCGESGKEIMQEMKIIQDLNQKATNRTFSMVLSPDPEDSKKLSRKELREMTREFMRKLNIDPDKQQYLAFVHTEKKHTHVHIIANRVRENGTLISDSHIGKRAQWAAHEIAKERGLISAKEKMFEKIKNIEKQHDAERGIKNQILKKHEFVMAQNPGSMETYMIKMKEQGVKVIPTINKQGQIQGHRMVDLMTGKSFKASEVHRQLGLKNLMSKGLPFKEQGVQLSKVLVPVQDMAMNLSVKIAKAVVKQAFKGITR